MKMRRLSVLLALVLVLGLSGCTDTNTETDDSGTMIQGNVLDTKGNPVADATVNVDGKTAASYTDMNGLSIQKIEIIHFHGTQQCSSCILLGQYAEETVNTYFSTELESGKITFNHINYDLPQNNELVMKYGVTGSSLWLGVYDENGFHKEENINVWYKLDNKQDFMNYLTGLLEKRMSGDFS